jgi:putative DNA-invertase from lambdoid prophage Rac
MSHRVAYYRVSTGDQNIEAQRHALGGHFDQEFEDIGVSGGTMAADRPGFAKLLGEIRKGDTLCVYAVDRLGRDALDVQSTVRRLLDKGVTVEIHGLGQIGRGVGEIILAVLAQVADMERQKIKERTAAGREAARAALQATGKTHRGKAGLGRPMAAEAAAVVAWRREHSKSIRETARHFGLSEATVKRYWANERPDPLADLGPRADPPAVQLTNTLGDRIRNLGSTGIQAAERASADDPLLDAPLD